MGQEWRGLCCGDSEFGVRTYIGLLRRITVLLLRGPQDGLSAGEMIDRKGGGHDDVGQNKTLYDIIT